MLIVVFGGVVFGGVVFGDVVFGDVVFGDCCLWWCCLRWCCLSGMLSSVVLSFGDCCLWWCCLWWCYLRWCCLSGMLSLVVLSLVVLSLVVLSFGDVVFGDLLVHFQSQCRSAPQAPRVPKPPNHRVGVGIICPCFPLVLSGRDPIGFITSVLQRVVESIRPAVTACCHPNHTAQPGVGWGGVGGGGARRDEILLEMSDDLGQ